MFLQKSFSLVCLLFTFNALGMERPEHTLQAITPSDVKRIFESKITWTHDSHINTPLISGSNPIVRFPATMKPEFELFFTCISRKDLELLYQFCAAIEKGESQPIKEYEKYRSAWPESVTTVADYYVKKETKDSKCDVL